MVIIEILNETHSMDELIALSRLFFADYESHHPDFFAIDALRPADVVTYFRSFIDAPGRCAWVALVGDTIVGYITAYIKEQPPFWRVKRVGEISGLMVARAYRHQSLATQLMDNAVRFFAQHDVRYYTLFTAIENTNARAFYRAYGMQELNVTLLGETDLDSG